MRYVGRFAGRRSSLELHVRGFFGSGLLGYAIAIGLYGVSSVLRVYRGLQDHREDFS